MSWLDPELQTLKKGDSIEGGTFMEALSDEPVLYIVAEPYDALKATFVYDAYWMGAHLGRFKKSPLAVKRL